MRSGRLDVPVRGSRVRNVVSAPCATGFAPEGPDRDAQDALQTAPHVREAFSWMATVPTAADKSVRAYVCTWAALHPSHFFS